MSIKIPAFVSKLILLVFPLLLVACASVDTVIQTWNEGESLDGEPASLTVPADLDVMSVNGRTIRNSFRQGETLTYRLKPATLQVVVRYQSRWTLGNSREGGSAGPEEEVASDPVQITFNAEPGASYRLEFDPPADRQAAKQLAPRFSARLVDASGEVLAKSTTVESPEPPAAVQTNLQLNQEKTAQPNQEKAAQQRLAPKLAGPGSNKPGVEGEKRMSQAERLQVLKDNWAEAGQQTRETFLKWALQ